MATCPDPMKFPPNSPQRAAAVKCMSENARAKQLKKIASAQAKQQAKNAKGPLKKMPGSAAGTGSSKDPAWKGVADLAKNGLPG